MEEQKNGVYTYCRKTTSYSTWSRQCFMTGEQCSKQSIVHKERKRLHDNNEINAFVVMNFSNMSDVVYKWKLSSFIESLKDHLYLNSNTDEIICVADTEDDPNTLKDTEPGWKKVTKIHVVRADSNTVSNYIICNRVCQQMQIADLVIVDVSVENTNVFYEFGMAVAFGKLILPICFNESFYQMHVPEKAQAYLTEKANKPLNLKFRNFNGQKNQSLKNIPGLDKTLSKNNQLREMIEHHIDCYPWRRKLFEYYGIRYRSKNSGVGYTDFEDIVDPVLGFSDIQYNQFPYDAILEDNKKVGEMLYGRLSKSYNSTIEPAQCADSNKSPYNTVVIYTMDKILNADQAGQCIINFYRNMTVQIWNEFCFCGDRVGIMGQANAIPDDPKDTKTDQKLLYRVGDIVRIGMNEATHLAQKQRIKTGDYLLGEHDEVTEETAAEIRGTTETNPEDVKSWGNEAIRFAKEHVRNRCIPIYPDEPIYVQELLHGVQKGILSDTTLKKKKKDNEFDYEHFFCLFHVTLHTLRYVNEIVVDLSQNSLQALFWLGVAHGRNAQAITVRHAPTAEELRLSGISDLPAERNIFDVAGLWTAILHSNNTEGFYHQLALAQIGIEQYSKLALPEAEIDQYKEQVLDEFYETSPYMKFGYERISERIKTLDRLHTENNEEDYRKLRSILSHLYSNDRIEKIWKALADRNREESKRLESYYRSLFWKRMLRYNELQLYTHRRKGYESETREPTRVSITWDMDAAAELSHYLSKRSTIGRYRIHALQTEMDDIAEVNKRARQGNFICIGGEAVPMDVPLIKHIRDNIDGESVARHLAYGKAPCIFTKEETRSYRGFFSSDGKAHNVFAQFVDAKCTGNLVTEQKEKEQEKEKRCDKFSLEDPPKFAPIKKYFDQEVTLTKSWEKTGKGEFKLPEDFKDPCQVCQNKENKCEQLAQMIMWREVPKSATDQKEKVRYWVSLVGVSGPATLALTSLLVDDQQKKELLPDKRGKYAALPLNNIQTAVRETLMEHYKKALEAQLEQQNIEDRLLRSEISYATRLYLSTVLYQYFFPFLSKADEERICNGMDAYASSVGFKAMFKDAPHQKITGAVTKALRETISGIRGVEALYRVEVKYGTDDMDDRSPQDIHLLRRDNRINDGINGAPVISCLFAKAPTE